MKCLIFFLRDAHDFMEGSRSVESLRAYYHSQTVEAEKLARLAEIEKAKQQAYADTIKEILGAIQPGLIEAISASSKAEILKTGMEAIGPYALANGDETIPETINKLVRGTTLENVINSDLFKTSK